MSFAKALLMTINSLEGGYILTNHEGDAGHNTYAGITEDLARRAGYQWNPPFDPVEVANIYRSQFWDPARCDELPEPSDAVLFQCVVNVGQGEGIKILQRAVGAVPDGDFGPKTLARVMATRREGLPDLILAYQNAFYRQLGGKWLRGWLNRTEKVRRAIAEGRI